MEATQIGVISSGEFSELVLLYHKRVLKKALSWSNNVSNAADIVQNTYLKAWTNRHSLRSKDAFGRWIEVICERECWLQRKRLKNELPLDLLPQSLMRAEESDSEEADNTHLYAALAQMSEKEIELLSLKYFASYSQQKISLVLGIPEKTVKSRLYDVRARLRKILDSMDSTHSIDLGLEFSKRREIIMNKLNLMEVGAYCIPRMSLTAQKELLHTAEENVQYSDVVLAELHKIEKGREFVNACDGKIDLNGLVEILSCCDQFTVDRMLENSQLKQDFLTRFRHGYVVTENNPILHTLDMERTIKWFEKTLGWHGEVDAKDTNGNGTYGCLLPDNPQAVLQKTRAFQGIHLFRGEPVKSTVSFIAVVGIEALYQYVIDSGWTEVEGIIEEPWGAKVCYVTTNDGYVLKFFEVR